MKSPTVAATQGDKGMHCIIPRWLSHIRFLMSENSIALNAVYRLRQWGFYLKKKDI